MNAPEMIPGTTERVSVEWLLQNLTATCEYDLDDGFGEMVNHKASDYSFSGTLDNIMRDGFRVPVVVNIGGWDDSDHLELGNGHHRLSAAILLCLDDMLVYWPEEYNMMAHGISYETSDYDDKTPSLDWFRGFCDIYSGEGVLY